MSVSLNPGPQAPPTATAGRRFEIAPFLTIASGGAALRKLSPEGIAAIRHFLGPQIDGLDPSRLSWVDGSTHPATRHITTKAGTIFQNERGVWQAAVWPKKAEAELKGLGLRDIPDHLGTQEALHALLHRQVKPDGTPITVQENEVVGEAVSIKRQPAHAVDVMRLTSAMIRGADLKAYAAIFEHSLQALGAVAERYGVGEGSQRDRGGMLLVSIMKSMKVKSPLDLTPKLLRDYAATVLKLPNPQEFVDTLTSSYLRTFEAAARDILGPPGAFRVR